MKLIHGHYQTTAETMQQALDNLINGNRVDMAKIIKNYGERDFFIDFKDFLHNTYVDLKAEYDYFFDCLKSYMIIKHDYPERLRGK